MEMLETVERAKAVSALCTISAGQGRELRDPYAGLLAAEDLNAVQKIFGKAITPSRLPEGPAPADPRLAQVFEVAEVKELGRIFESCLPSLTTPMARAGDSHIYVWNDGERCIAGVVRDGPYGFRLDQVSGPRNRKVSDQTKAEILAAFNGQVERRAAVWELLNDI